ncbi:MAG: hydroxymethylbilane synthase [Elusimicrobia bacterium]|nr:hydroxymethylbilane synthase [Elusimicrobiota bacterium]
MKIRLGTRGSALATTQAGWVRRRLEALHPGLEVELVIITTSGDRFSMQRPFSDSIPGHGKALFVKEIEEALLKGAIDAAVHSAKDLPAALLDVFVVGAYPAREDPSDAWVARPGGPAFMALPAGARVASASLRRRVQLQRLRGDLEVVAIRGNIDTRLRKLEEGFCDGLILAAAGLLRLGKKDRISGLFDAAQIVPAPGQGALALEIRADRTELRGIVGALDDPDTRAAVECEREFLKRMGGSCELPLGALAQPDGDWMRLSVFWSELSGKNPVRLSGRGRRRAAAELAKDLSERVRQAAGMGQ